MDQPKRRMSDLAPARPKAHPVPPALRHKGEGTSHAVPHAQMTKARPSHADALREKAARQARAVASRRGGASELADPSYAQAPLHPLPHSTVATPASPPVDPPEPSLQVATPAPSPQPLPQPVAADSPKAMRPTRPRTKRRAWRVAAQLFLSLVIILLVAVAIVFVYARYYQ